MSETFADAIEFEAGFLDLDSLMEEVSSIINIETEDKKPQLSTEDKIMLRKLSLAKMHREKELEEIQNMRGIIVKDWDKRIDKRKSEINDIDGLIDNMVRNRNSGESVKLDIGTYSMRSVPYKVRMTDETKLRKHLMTEGTLASYLKAAPLDTTLVTSTLLSKFKEEVQKEADLRFESEQLANPDKKLTNTYKNKVLKELEEARLPAFMESLPTGLEFVPSYKNVSLKSTLKR